jgi:site-specific DNA-methyltransferase (adenine-specific)
MASKIAIKNRIKELRYVTAQELEPHPLQHRLHPDKQKQALDAALREIGIADALLAYEVDGKLRLIDGHGRREVAPDTKWPVLILDVNDAEAKQILAQHDALAGLAEIDAGALDALLREVSSGEEALQALFAEMALDAGLYQDEQPGKGGDEFDVDAAMPQGETRSRLGDIWQLGRHRVLCGDSTDAAQVARLMQGEKAALVVTSPPYNQKLDAFKPSGMQKENPAFVHRMAESYEDSMPEDEYQKQQIALLEMLPKFMQPNGSIFYNHKIRYRDKRVVSPYEWLLKLSYPLRQEIIWDRGSSITLNARMFIPAEERIYWLRVGDDFVFNDTSEIKAYSTVWEIAAINEIQASAAFATEIPTRCIIAASRENDIVLEPFCGSGTTLIASERNNRRCYGAELTPKWVDVILARWEAETGKEARLLERV